MGAGDAKEQAKVSATRVFKSSSFQYDEGIESITLLHALAVADLSCIAAVSWCARFNQRYHVW